MIIKENNKLLLNKSLLKGTLFSLFSFINKGLVFLLLLILANFIAPAEYGYLGLFSTVAMVVGYFVAMSSEGYFSVAFFRDGKEGLTKSSTAIFWLSIVFCSVVALILIVFGKESSLLLNLPLNMLWLLLPIAFFTLYTNLNLDLFRLQEKVKMYGIFSCGNAIFNFVLSIILVKYCLLGWEGRIYAQVICFSLFGFIGLLYLRKLIERFDWAYTKMILLYGIPLIPHNAVAFMRQGLDRYIINANFSIEEVGLFSFAMNLANIIMTIGLGFNQTNSIEIYKVLGDNSFSTEEKKRIITSQRKKLSIVYLVAALIVVVVCMPTIPLILPKYADAMPYFPILAVYTYFFCQYLLYTNYLFFYKKTKQIMYITFGTSIFHFLLSLWLTRYSMYLTCLVYCISQGVIFIMIRYIAQKELYKNLTIAE